MAHQASTAHAARGNPCPAAGGSAHNPTHRPVGADPQAGGAGVDEFGRVNYVTGTDPKQWLTNITTFAKVRYASVYPGIDVVYYANDRRQLEYDFVVAPGADPKRHRTRH